ncbi:hypothetical protein ACFFU1_00090 [Algibacter miyuki]|uniref:Uncharacterized protein n=1 Tax=Algibacter miyuki TaxID=1306933 RepID=A0ABV5GUU7_9FLAO|nr:hypothetical protein [Algibacter miyuki]MDN3664607.1 hypothetical protein [Algibacter miyuki]
MKKKELFTFLLAAVSGFYQVHAEINFKATHVISLNGSHVASKCMALKTNLLNSKLDISSLSKSVYAINIIASEKSFINKLVVE